MYRSQEKHGHFLCTTYFTILYLIHLKDLYHLYGSKQGLTIQERSTLPATALPENDEMEYSGYY